MNVGFASRLGAFLLTTLLMLVVAGVMAYFITGTAPVTSRLRIATVLQDVLLFIVPPVATAVIACRQPARLLLLNRLDSRWGLVAVVMAMVVSVPVMNCIVSLNEAMQLPSWLSSMEAWMRSAEASAAANVAILMGDDTVGSLVMNLLIVGVLAGFSEEIFFRGGLQQILLTRPMNPHVAIWTTAVVFSAFHMQFYGFLPRLLLGAYFGYLAWWSRSLWLPVVAHALNNSAVVVTSWLEKRGDISDAVNTVGSVGDNGTDLGVVIVSGLLTAMMLMIIYRIFTLRQARRERGPVSRNACDGK